MSIINRVKQTRPNIAVGFFTPGAEVITRLDELVAAGEIESYNLNEESADGLKKTMTFTFKDTNALDNFLNEDVSIDSRADRNTYCGLNNIILETEE